MKEASKQSEYNRKFNQFDGLWHDDDGLRKFLDGQVVAGVNNNSALNQISSRYSMAQRYAHEFDIQDMDE